MVFQLEGLAGFRALDVGLAFCRADAQGCWKEKVGVSGPRNMAVWGRGASASQMCGEL